MLTCIIRYHIDPTKKAQFEQYARNWGQAIPRKAPDFILHETLQPRLTRGDHAGLAPEVQPIIATVLHGSDAQLEQQINAAPNPAYIRHRLREAGFSTPYDKHADGL